VSEYTAIYHPATKRFICKIDFERGIMFVKDRGFGAYIDLTQLRSDGVACDECGERAAAGGLPAHHSDGRVGRHRVEA